MKPIRVLWPLLALCLAVATAGVQANPAFDDWADRFAADWIRASPERATFAQYFGGAEQAALDSRLSPNTDAQRQRILAIAREGLAEVDRWLQAELPPALTPAQRAGALTMRWSLARQLEGERFADHYFPFSQTNGLHVRAVGLFNEGQPLRRATDVPVYLARLAELVPRIDESIARARKSAERGLLPPKFIAERVRGQLVTLIEAPLDMNPVVSGFARRIATVPELAPEAREQASARVRSLVGDQIRPALERVLALIDELLPKTGDAAGFSAMPDGVAAYATALASNTTTSLSADEVHQIGLREVARIEAEMDRVLRELGYREGSVNARVEQLRLKLQPPTDPDPRPGLIAKFGQYVRDSQQRAQKLFNLQPKMAVEVRREPPLTERTAAAHYSTPAPDGSRPGVFWAPLPGPTFNIAGMRTLAVHEAVPGHHFQLTVQQETESLPRWRRLRVFGGGSAHSEGWALYAERLAIESGWYEGDPVSLLGALDAQLFRARRLVVDTGLHTKGWSRQQAIDYGIVAQEVERYVVNPGQACAYMIGMLRIVALRDEAQATLGARFDLRDFHDVVLRTGSVPLDVLGEVVRDWTRQRLEEPSTRQRLEDPSTQQPLKEPAKAG